MKTYLPELNFRGKMFKFHSIPLQIFSKRECFQKTYKVTPNCFTNVHHILQKFGSTQIFPKRHFFSINLKSVRYATKHSLTENFIKHYILFVVNCFSAFSHFLAFIKYPSTPYNPFHYKKSKECWLSDLCIFIEVQ